MWGDRIPLPVDVACTVGKFVGAKLDDLVVLLLDGKSNFSVTSALASLAADTLLETEELEETVVALLELLNEDVDTCVVLLVLVIPATDTPLSDDAVPRMELDDGAVLTKPSLSVDVDFGRPWLLVVVVVGLVSCSTVGWVVSTVLGDSVIILGRGV